MGLFDFLRPKQRPAAEEPAHLPVLKIQGPAYIRPYMKPADQSLLKQLFIKVHNNEWVGELVSGNNNRFFSICYFGNLLSNTIIASKDQILQKVMAIASDTQEEILLFDKALHGWDGFICNCYPELEEADRSTDTTYISKTGTTKFQIVFLARYSEGTRKELLDTVDKDGNIELENGTKIPLQEAFDNAFDYAVIYAVDENGKSFKLIDEELA